MAPTHKLWGALPHSQRAFGRGERAARRRGGMRPRLVRSLPSDPQDGSLDCRCIPSGGRGAANGLRELRKRQSGGQGVLRRVRDAASAPLCRMRCPEPARQEFCGDCGAALAGPGRATADMRERVSSTIASSTSLITTPSTSLIISSFYRAADPSPSTSQDRIGQPGVTTNEAQS